MSADGSIHLPLTGKTIRAADLFCGAGGTSTGARRAITELGGKLKLTAVNHWDIAIQTHSAMHPEAKHLCADLEHVRPREAVPEGVLDLLMASPTCTYYSRARGGRPVHDQQRMDPWHVVRWCTELRVHRLLVENVPEMVEWGPCSIVTGRPIPSRKGEYFRAWLEALKAIGFRIDWKVLCCADYGDPTTRERFFLIGRSDRKSLSWPEPTHVKGGKTDLFGTRKPWRAASEIIDWSREGKSIFRRAKPLKPNTLRRIYAGAVRNRWPQPYIDALQALIDGREPVLDFELVNGVWHAPAAMVMAPGSTGAARDVGQPTPTVVGSVSHHLIEPLLMGVSSNAAAHPVSDPAPTITTGGGSSPKRPGNARPQLIEPIVMRGNVGTGRTGDMRPASEPMPTVTCSESLALATPMLSPYYGSTAFAQPVTDPVPAVTTKARFGLAEPIVMRASHGDSDGRDPATRVLDPSAPLPTQTGSTEFSVATPLLVGMRGTEDSQIVSSAKDVGEPVGTVTASGNHHALIVPVCNSSSAGVPRPASLPLATITTVKGGDKALATPVIVPVTHHGDRKVNGVDEPLPTITGANRGELGLSTAFVIRAGHGGDALKRPASHVIGIDRPLPTITSGGDFGLSTPFLVPNFGEAPGQAPRTHAISEPLPAVTSHGAGGVVEPVAVADRQFVRIDIHYRMLHWRELAGAMSFDVPGEIYQFAGNGTQITKQIGNAVPGQTAKALVRALVER